MPEHRGPARIGSHPEILFPSVRQQAEDGGSAGGLQFRNLDEACVHGVHRTPALLGRIVRPTADTFPSTEVSDGKRTICMVRRKVIIERHQDGCLAANRKGRGPALVPRSA
ncbi:MAG: hypothetical protein JWP51_1734 [Bradyrhizobium sp.]|nr:hypothetical protein [Bradyrhizobium sp.]